MAAQEAEYPEQSIAFRYIQCTRCTFSLKQPSPQACNIPRTLEEFRSKQRPSYPRTHKPMRLLQVGLSRFVSCGEVTTGPCGFYFHLSAHLQPLKDLSLRVRGAYRSFPHTPW